MTLKGHGKFGGKLNVGCLFSPEKNLPILFQRATGLKFQISWDSFFLKGTLVEPKSVAQVSSYDTERPWKVWGESDYWFPIQP